MSLENGGTHLQKMYKITLVQTLIFWQKMGLRFLSRILQVCLTLVTRICGSYEYNIEASPYGFSMRLTHAAT